MEKGSFLMIEGIFLIIPAKAWNNSHMISGQHNELMWTEKKKKHYKFISN